MTAATITTDLEKSDCYLVIIVMPRHFRKEPGTIGADVDLDTEEVYLADGRRLTEQIAEELAHRALARHRGRPSADGRRYSHAS
jgi:hypothetical protein